MDKKTKEFQKSLVALKGRVAVFREYSHIALVNVLDITTTNDEFSITFKLNNAKPKDEPITIGSVWSNTSIDKNGFSIAYVGSQMMISEYAVAEFKLKSSKMKSDRERIDLFRRLLDGEANDIVANSTITAFNITVEIEDTYDGGLPKQIWNFEIKNGCWKVVRTDYRWDEGMKRTKHKMLVSPKSICKFLAILSNTKIPVVLQFEMGCDGGFTEFSYGNAGGSFMLRWWSAPPKELESLSEDIKALLEDLTDA